MCGHRATRYSTTTLDRDLRASDADRERAADVLRDNAGERARSPHWHPIVLLLAVVVAVSVIAGHPAFWIAFPLFFWVWRPLMRPRWRV